MRRRKFITLVGGMAATWPLAAHVQQAAGELAVVGAIYTVRSENSEAFLRGLLEAGYVDGQRIHLEERFTGTALMPPARCSSAAS